MLGCHGGAPTGALATLLASVPSLSPSLFLSPSPPPAVPIRMESTGEAGRIHVSQAFASLLPNERWLPTGGVEVKGKVRAWAPDTASRGD